MSADGLTCLSWQENVCSHTHGILIQYTPGDLPYIVTVHIMHVANEASCMLAQNNVFMQVTLYGSRIPVYDCNYKHVIASLI